MNGDLDTGLKTLLVDEDRAPDDLFASRVRRLVATEERLRVDQRRRWRRFAVEMIATAAVLATFLLLARVRGDVSDVIPLFSPAGAGLLLLTLWLVVSARTATTSIPH